MSTPFNIKQNATAIATLDALMGPGVIHNVNIESYDTAAWFMMFDKAGPPVLDDVPLFVWRIAAAGDLNVSFPGPSPQVLIGQAYTLGLSFGWSSTSDTYTPAAVGGRWCATGVRQ